MASFRLDNAALLKILLHGAKYATHSINGLLIGRTEEEKILIVDAIPLFHTSLSLAPPLEIALALVEDRLSESEDRIVGLYVSDALIGKDDFDVTSKTIANKIASLTVAPATLSLILDNESLGRMMQDDDILPFKFYRRNSGTGSDEWVLCADSDFVATDGRTLKSLFVSLLDQHVHKDLHDVDDHLDDIRTCFSLSVCAMSSSVELLALSSYLTYSSPGCLFLLSLTLTVINFALFCSSRARKQSFQFVVAAGNLLLVSILALAVLGLPIGFLYLAFQGLVWLTASLADTIPALKNIQSALSRVVFR